MVDPVVDTAVAAGADQWEEHMRPAAAPEVAADTVVAEDIHPSCLAVEPVDPSEQPSHRTSVAADDEGILAAQGNHPAVDGDKLAEVRLLRQRREWQRTAAEQVQECRRRGSGSTQVHQLRSHSWRIAERFGPFQVQLRQPELAAKGKR